MIGLGVIMDGMWRINKLIDDVPSINNSKKYLGTNFLEIPYNIFKKKKNI